MRSLRLLKLYSRNFSLALSTAISSRRTRNAGKRKDSSPGLCLPALLSQLLLSSSLLPTIRTSSASAYLEAFFTDHHIHLHRLHGSRLPTTSRLHHGPQLKAVHDVCTSASTCSCSSPSDDRDFNSSYGSQLSSSSVHDRLRRCTSDHHRCGRATSEEDPQGEDPR